MIKNIILASQSGIRKKILQDNGYIVKQVPSRIDEDEIKISMEAKNATCLQIAKSLAELKASKISNKNPEDIVIGADSLLDLDGKNISKPKTKEDAKKILVKLNNKTHYLHTAACICKGGSMISHFHESCKLIMKNLTDKDLNEYLNRLDIDIIKKYGVYQIEAGGLELFAEINGDMNSIMGLPIKQINKYLEQLK